jgi:hypothetical protein
LPPCQQLEYIARKVWCIQRELDGSQTLRSIQDVDSKHQMTDCLWASQDSEQPAMFQLTSQYFSPYQNESFCPKLLTRASNALGTWHRKGLTMLTCTTLNSSQWLANGVEDSQPLPIDGYLTVRGCCKPPYANGDSDVGLRLRGQ